MRHLLYYVATIISFLLLISQHAELSAFGVECFPLESLRLTLSIARQRPYLPTIGTKSELESICMSTWECATDRGMLAF